MLEQVLNTTRVVTADAGSDPALCVLCDYLAGPGARVAVVRDPVALPALEALCRELSAREGTVILDRVQPNPTAADISAMAGALNGKAVDVVIGIGGGSTLDSAKGVAALLGNGGDLEEYLGPQASRKLEGRSHKLVLIPTTAGTGAEVTRFGVYTARTGRKYTLNTPWLQADAAVLIPELTLTMPPGLTAATAFDALSHALEALWNRNATPVSDLAASRAAADVLTWMDTAWRSAQTGSREGRAEMLAASCRAGIAFNMTGTAADHALSFVLSEEWHLPHGTACAFALDAVYELNCRDAAVQHKLAALAARVLHTTAPNAVALLLERIRALRSQFGLPGRFAEIGASGSAGELSAVFAKSLSDPKMANNAVPVGEPELLALLQEKC